MYRGQVTAVDAKGVYVLVPSLHPTAAFGPLDHVGARPAVGARVLVADCGDESAPDLVVMTGSGPTSSTDNAIARFDGTGGALQGSGISIADDTTLFGPKEIILHAAGNPADGGGGSIRTAGGRYTFVLLPRNADATYASGSEFYYDADYAVWVAECDLTAGGTVRAAGVELGSGGPTITRGTGAPTHSAPDGSVWLRTDGTASTTLYVRAAGAWSALS